MLGVTLSRDAAIALLETRASEFSDLLSDISVEKAFAQLSAEEIDDDWAVRTAYNSLITLPGVGPTKATKLLARKRPHVVPLGFRDHQGARREKGVLEAAAPLAHRE